MLFEKSHNKECLYLIIWELRKGGQSQHAGVLECFPGQAPLTFLKAAKESMADKGKDVPARAQEYAHKRGEGVDLQRGQIREPTAQAPGDTYPRGNPTALKLV